MADQIDDLEDDVEDEDIQDVVIDAPAADDKIAAKEEPPVVAPEDGIAELRASLEKERAARIEAERRANEASREVHMARGQVDDTNLQLVDSAIDTLTNNSAILKQNYAAALQNGDFAAAAEIQDEMNDTTSKLNQLQNGKAAMLEDAKRRREQPAPQPPGDIVENFASQLSQRSADWIRAHPDYVRNPQLNARMIKAHDFIVADGVPPDTDEYFSRIETMLRIKAPPVAAQSEEAMEMGAQMTQRRTDTSPPAAPVSRAPAPGARQQVVRLSAAEREIAEMSGMKPEEYARQKLALQKEGKIK